MVTVRQADPHEVRARLEAELECILGTLDRIDDIEQVWLTGSLVEGRLHATSDIDLVVVRRTSTEPGARGTELARVLQPRVGLDLFVYTPEEFDRGGRFIEYVRSRGRRIR